MSTFRGDSSVFKYTQLFVLYDSAPKHQVASRFLRSVKLAQNSWSSSCCALVIFSCLELSSAKSGWVSEPAEAKHRIGDDCCRS